MQMDDDLCWDIIDFFTLGGRGRGAQSYPVSLCPMRESESYCIFFPCYCVKKDLVYEYLKSQGADAAY